MWVTRTALRSRTKRWKARACLCSILLVALALFLFSGTSPPKEKARYPPGKPRSSPFITTWPSTASSFNVDPGDNDRRDVKTVLLWTEFFGNRDWGGGTPTAAFERCPAVKECRVTADKGQLASAHALLVNLRDFRSLSDLPPVHPPGQVWIAHTSEPPYYVYVDLASLAGVFNWTSSYRTDADIYSPYGYFEPKVGSASAAVKDDDDEEEDEKWRRRTTTTTVSRTGLPSPVYDAKAISQQIASEDPFSLHSRSIFWAASSCINYGQRYRLVTRLGQHLPVDTFGACGELECARDDLNCEDKLSQYKFVLAFENGYCRDYVTEKYWNALLRMQIPIVSGGADYSLLAVPGSYIDVDDFDSVTELADYIQKVSTDRELYNSYFNWTSRYRLKSRQIVNWCQLCEALHDGTRPAQTYRDLQGWLADDSCPLHNDYHWLWWGKQYFFFKYLGF